MFRTVGHALPVVFLLLLGVTLADEAEKKEAVAHLEVRGMECEGTCPAAVKKSLEGPGVIDVSVDFAKKSATLRYDPEKTRATEALARLVRAKAYSESKLLSVETVYESTLAKVHASAKIEKLGARTKLHVAIEPLSGHGLNTDKDSPALEIELKKLPDGFHSKEPVVKHKGGVKAPHAFDLEFETASRTKSGEYPISVELRLEAVKGATRTPATIDLTVPVLVP